MSVVIVLSETSGASGCDYRRFANDRLLLPPRLARRIPTRGLSGTAKPPGRAPGTVPALPRLNALDCRTTRVGQLA